MTTLPSSIFTLPTLLLFPPPPPPLPHPLSPPPTHHCTIVQLHGHRTTLKVRPCHRVQFSNYLNAIWTCIHIHHNVWVVVGGGTVCVHQTLIYTYVHVSILYIQLHVITTTKQGANVSILYIQLHVITTTKQGANIHTVIVVVYTIKSVATPKCKQYMLFNTHIIHIHTHMYTYLRSLADTVSLQ